MKKCHEHTVRATIRRWQDGGLGGLWEASGRGAKRKWSEADLQYLEQCLELEERTYNSLQLAHKLCQERQVKLSPDRLRHLWQKRAIRGNAHGTVIEPNKILSTNESNKLS